MIEKRKSEEQLRTELSEHARCANRAVLAAQEENRRLGIPNVYSINGKMYWELPSGELSLSDPWVDPNAQPAELDFDWPPAGAVKESGPETSANAE